MFRFEVWHKGDKPTSYAALFLDNSGYYVGFLHNAEGELIGDFYADDSVEMERRLGEIMQARKEA